MSRIIVLGGTGYTGAAIVAEAARRGHEVLAVSRTAPDSLPQGATHRSLDLQDREQLGAVLDGADVVIAASSPRGDLAAEGALRAIYASVAEESAARGVRVGVIGGAGSLRVSEDGPLLSQTPDFPEAFQLEAAELSAVLADLRQSPEQLDWFFVSPAAGFGSYAPGEAKGTYRVGGEVLLSDDDGESFISGADLALAVVDEIETPAHRRQRFGVAY